MKEFNFKLFSKDFQRRRLEIQLQRGLNLSLRDISRESKVDHLVIHRAIKGNNIAVNNLINLLSWADLDFNNYVGTKVIYNCVKQADIKNENKKEP